MMKQPNTLLHKRDTQTLRSVKDALVVLAACGCGDVFHA